MATAAPPEIVNQKPAVEETMTDPPLASVMEKPNDVMQDKSAIPPPPPDDSKTTAVVDQTAPDTSAAMKSSKGSHDRDIALAKVEDEKRLSFVKAWEESEKSKVENKAQKKLSEVSSWENSKKASLEAQLRKIEVTSSKSSECIYL
ncbi:Hypothetical predicted protein [Olea europaea subsp. europaea]|uniref:Remorin n=1 Tax=Olea europaea subsp. europaea TaxID=158383 RepID=A0A8S0ULI3_OLEEU|nr:Hypothetical predicted protein [Olea europaea subsp. europaea]